MMEGLTSVLVVDDSRAMRELLTTLLSTHCQRVMAASSCKEAEVIDASGDLDLVVCDVYMEDGLGFEVLEHGHRTATLRREPPTSSTARGNSSPSTRCVGGRALYSLSSRAQEGAIASNHYCVPNR